MSPFRFQPLQIPQVILIETTAFADHRGFFMETFKHSEFARYGMTAPFVQDNYSHSVRGVLRGLHYQKRAKAQGKLVRVLSGEIFDVVVDIRRQAPTYGQWVGIALSAASHLSLYVPPGFAHGFCVLSAEAGVLYKTSWEYAADAERGIVWNDPDLDIHWPMTRPVVSSKDAALPRFVDADNDFD